MARHRWMGWIVVCMFFASLFDVSELNKWVLKQLGHALQSEFGLPAIKAGLANFNFDHFVPNPRKILNSKWSPWNSQNWVPNQFCSCPLWLSPAWWFGEPQLHFAASNALSRIFRCCPDFLVKGQLLYKMFEIKTHRNTRDCFENDRFRGEKSSITEVREGDGSCVVDCDGQITALWRVALCYYAWKVPIDAETSGTKVPIGTPSVQTSWDNMLWKCNETFKSAKCF